jgi:hypothetical protein
LGILYKERRGRGYLKELFRVLDDEGTAVVSALNNDGDFKEEEELWLEGEQGVRYRKMLTETEWDEEGRVRTDRLVVERYREGKRDEKMKCEWSLVVKWDFEEWKDDVEEAGLRMVDVKRGLVEDWWILTRKSLD